jgi:hypothetical protein
MRKSLLTLVADAYVVPLMRNLILHGRQDSFDEGSAHRKAATYTQDNTNTE